MSAYYLYSIIALSAAAVYIVTSLTVWYLEKPGRDLPGWADDALLLVGVVVSAANLVTPVWWWLSR